MPWWGWLVFGFALLAGEVAAPGGFFLLFFGVGALLVGGLELVGAGFPVWAQWLSFSILSVGSLLLLRPHVVGRLRHGGRGIEDTLVGEVATALEPLAPGAIGRGELRGSTFSVRNDGSDPLEPGERCRVTRVDGLLLHVRREPASG